MKPEIVMVGRSNVGKSTLLQQLTGKKIIRTGKRPGTTREIVHYELNHVIFTDLPGFGFMLGVSRKKREKIKKNLVQYLEKNRKNILFTILVIDSKAMPEICERWSSRGEIPIDVEFYQFLNELKLNPIVIANKIDKVPENEQDTQLDLIVDWLGLTPPWRQWRNIIAPISAKTGEGLDHLKLIMLQKLQTQGLEEIMGDIQL